MLNKLILIIFEPLVAVLLMSAALLARFMPKKIDVGLGPLPLINNVYHKKVIEKCGYSAETFVMKVWHITDAFDVRWDKSPLQKIPVLGKRINAVRVLVWMLFRYRSVLIYFNGTMGFMGTMWLWRLEPYILKLAGVKTIVLPYGSDVQVMSRAPNLLFKDAISKDYPTHRFAHNEIAAQIDMWTRHGSHIVSGCEWVYYMYHWDTLMISHFSLDTNDWKVSGTKKKGKKSKMLKVLHAPNHRTIKGTSHVIEAVKELKAEGYDIELVLAEKLPNHEIRALIEEVDVVVDQLIVGWYAMFAIEAMALETPVICHLRDDLEDLFRAAGLYGKDELIPMIDATPLTIKDTLAKCCQEKDTLADLGKESREYVVRHHSIHAVSKAFGKILQDVLGK